MTEQEYIDATNLAKLRTIRNILHDCLPMRPKEEEMEREIRLLLAKWVDWLEKNGAKVRT